MWNSFVNWLAGIGDFFKKAARTALGLFVDKMHDAALAYVTAAENAPAGTDKHAYAFRKLRAEYPNTRTAAINLAIELAVAIIDPKD